jgi:serine phosphatase RsbU (regulator of sigma subunit)
VQRLDSTEALQIGRRKRATLPPWLQGAFVTAVVASAILAITAIIYTRAESALIGEIHSGLLRTASIALRALDAEAHKQFAPGSDEDAPAYQQAILPLREILDADDNVAFAYTAVLRDGKVYFVLDGTPPPAPGEADDTVAVFEEYAPPPPDLLTALREARSMVSRPYTDKWGTFISAYQPFSDQAGELVGVVGIDLKMDNYLRRLEPIRDASLLAAALGVLVAILMGAAVWINRRNDRNARELGRRLRTVNALLAVSRALGSSVELRDLLPTIVKQATAVMGTEQAALYLRDGPKGRLTPRYADRALDLLDGGLDYATRGVVGRVASGGRLANVANPDADADFDAAVDNPTGGELRNLLALPIIDADENTIGVLRVGNRIEPGAFERDDEILLDALVTQIVVALDRARLTEVYVEKQKLDETLRLAASIQMNMLPHDFSGRELERVDLHALLIPAKEVGGDFYDFFAAGDGRLLFVVADVSGKGMAAALFMAKAKTLIKAHASVIDAPEAILARANDELAVNNDDGMFVTVFLAQFDPRTGLLRYANAGHNPPFRIAPDGTVSRVPVPRTLALGLMEGVAYRSDEIQMWAGEALFVYSDGINEAMNAADEQFEYTRMEAVLASAPRSARAIDDAMLAAVREFAAGAEQSDDITALTVRWRGT